MAATVPAIPTYHCREARTVIPSTWRILAAVAVVVFTATSVHPVRASSSSRAVELEEGEAFFGSGRFSGPANFQSLVMDRLTRRCTDNEERCRQYEIRVAEAGHELRVSVDTPACNERAVLEVYDPAGEPVAARQTCYSAEVGIDDAVSGMWRVLVMAENSQRGMPFRIRASLLADSAAREESTLLPNLRVEPPSRFTFDLPGTVPGTTRSCTDDEAAENGAENCLRFTLAPQNIGPGRLHLWFSNIDGRSAAPTVFQRIFHRDGTHRDRPAGTASYHPYHRHFHLTDLVEVELFKVRRGGGVGRKVGVTQKSGFCLSDFKISSWRRFHPRSSYSSRSNCNSLHGASMGLSAGWSDVYSENISGNYVDFGDSGPGRYLVRAAVDPNNDLREISENDNNSYAVVEVEEGKVEVLERGFGRDPWDETKVIVRDWWEPRRD